MIMKKITRTLLALLLAAVCIMLCACGAEPEPDPTEDPNLLVLDYTLVAENAADLQILENYVNLQTLDLRGSSCYEAIESYISAHPQVKVTYDVQIGANRYTPELESLALNEGEYELQQLLENIRFLPNLANLELPKTGLDSEELQQIRDAYPNLELRYTVELFGREMGMETTELDLSDMKPAQVEELADVLALLPELQTINLMASDGTSAFTPVDVKKVMDAAGEATVLYTFELFGKTVSTTDERVEFKKVKIGNEGIPQIREALDILPNCTYFLMDTCGVDNEVMAQLRSDYPDTKVVWRVFWAFYHDLTDMEMIHCTCKLTDENVEVLKYCNDVKYLDIGHNSDLSNIDFVKYMPKLEIAIVVDSKIESLEPFASCPNLQWLEIVNCHKIDDLSPLTNCKELKGLNMSCAYDVKDLTPLFELENMERLYLGSHLVPKEMVEAAREAMPDCWITDFARSSGNVSRNYAIGWRLDRKDVRAEWYKEIREIFRYSENFYNGKFD